MARQYHRKQIDPGLAGTRSWIARWYGDTSDLSIDSLWINCPPWDFLSAIEKEHFESLESANQSFLHAYLKFSGFRWLMKKSAFPDTIRSEVICYSPIEELCTDIRYFDENGQEIDILSPKILYDNNENFPLYYGHSIRIDLHSFDISIEIGGTSPFNLLTPLLEGLVDSAVWIPFPAELSTKEFTNTSPHLPAVRAYIISLIV